jgi:hypothetical protein
MKKLLEGTLPLSLAVAPGFAAALFQGNFATEDQVALSNITVTTAETITIETYSYAGQRVFAFRRRRVDRAAAAQFQLTLVLTRDK